MNLDNGGLLETNKVFLQGEVKSNPILSHVVKGEEFFSFDIEVPRLSGQSDTIPIVANKKLCIINEIKQGQYISVKGQFRSHNQIVNGKRRLVLMVFAKDIGRFEEEKNSNVIELEGYICKPAIYRTTPFAREICDVLLAVNRNFNKSDYIPCIAWGTNAQIVSNLKVSSKLKIEGRVQSRIYNKADGDKILTKTAYEVSIARLID